MTVEDFTNKLRVAGQSENVDEYRKTLNRISETIYFAHYPPSRSWEVVPGSTLSPKIVSEKVDPTRAVVQAAMWTSGIAVRGRNNSVTSTVDGGTNLGLSQIWKGTSLEPLANTCEETLDQAKPRLSNRIAKIDVEKM